MKNKDQFKALALVTAKSGGTLSQRLGIREDSVAYAVDYAAALCVWRFEQEQKAQEREFQVQTIAAMMGVQLKNNAMTDGPFDSRGRVNFENEDLV